MMFIIRRLPLTWQARHWAKRAMMRRHTSHFRVEAIKGLRATAGIPLKEAATLINVELAKMGVPTPTAQE